MDTAPTGSAGPGAPAVTPVAHQPAAAPTPPTPPAESAKCVECHRTATPRVVTDWELSVHSQQQIGCADCHGTDHQAADDFQKLHPVTYQTCNACHEEQVAQFSRGKHAHAWSSMEAMPTTHYKPMELIQGMKGCGGCHKLGIKTDEQVAALKKEDGMGFGLASCDACHTRHTFSVKEAREPEACATCHMGFDHPQWEMYSTSKHGVRHALKRQGVLPESAAAPTCQTCHMPNGDHEVRTAWGFLAVRTDGLAPYPGETPEWWQDRVTILQALGVLDPEGKPTKRLEAVAAVDAARLSKDAFDAERAKMLGICAQCHSENFAADELRKGDDMIRHTDALLAEAIRVVAGLYEDGTLKRPDTYQFAFPDLLTFHDAPTTIETRLFNMHLEHRMRAFQGAFHNNPDYTLWYGWNEMVQDLTDIKAMAADLRAEKQKEAGAAGATGAAAAEE